MAKKQAMPRWATPERQQHLVRLFERSGGFCVWGHPNCQNADHHYEEFINALIKDWRSDDRQEQAALWELERKAMHALGERIEPVRGMFSAISRDIYHGDQPMYYLMGLGWSAVTKTPFAKVRVASTYEVLFVDLGDTLKRKFNVSKNRRRKALRYGKSLPLEADQQMALMIQRAVIDHRNK